MSHIPVCFFWAGSEQTRERSRMSLAKHFRLTEVAFLPAHAVSQGEERGVGGQEEKTKLRRRS